MKIHSANLIHSLSRNAGGLYESVRRLVQSLEDEGVGVGVFGTSDSHTAEDIGLWAPTVVKIFKPIWPESFGYSPGYLNALEEYAPDIIHTHGIWLYPSMAARRYCLSTGARSIISAHGMLDPWAVNNSKWKKAIAYALFEQAHLENADCLRALCPSEAESIRKVGLKSPIAIIPNGIDLPEGPPDLPAPWSGRIAADRKVLLYLGRIHPKKGLPELLRAWAELRKENQKRSANWVLVICGWDQSGHEAELQQICDTLSLPWADLRVATPSGVAEPSVLFTGPQFNDAKSAAYHHSDAFILPSFSEGLPMVVLEAWAYGLPVLITPECNLPEGTETEAAIGIATNAAAIAEGMRRLLEMTDAERKAMGLRGRLLILNKFNWRSIAQTMKRLYEWMLGGGDSPDCVLR